MTYGLILLLIAAILVLALLLILAVVVVSARRPKYAYVRWSATSQGPVWYVECAKCRITSLYPNASDKYHALKLATRHNDTHHQGALPFLKT